MKRNHSRAAGFTLLEIVIVLILLGTIMAFVAPKIFGNLERANQARAKANITQIEGQLEIMKLEAGRYPTTSEGLAALITKPGSMEKWNGPYIKDAGALKDPWGNDFKYSQPGQNGKAFDIVSMGADGKDGGEGDNKDISN
ncbi:type II secretion system major pseudopilin GspG [Usitatibacter palustris]|uniref:Type II secretion system core protein G n=1 Tax=Usitatibacter palustris TaxID=2732487 RepID=A0A6M4H9N8_9PROT|nr:type II secretion system major pseudopilin GspG [Usitatibacter palustris]QJR16479.1 Type II secretion system protein G [Usitatibacter palustris]